MGPVNKLLIGCMAIGIVGLMTLFAYERVQPPPPTPQDQLRALIQRADHGDAKAQGEICDDHPEVNAVSIGYCLQASQRGDEKALAQTIEDARRADRDCDYGKSFAAQEHKPYPPIIGKAEQGDVAAQFEEGFASYIGNNCSYENTDYAEAYFWFSLASQGSPPSKDGINYTEWKTKTEKKLTHDQISAADKRVSEWKPTPAHPGAAAQQNNKDASSKFAHTHEQHEASPEEQEIEKLMMESSKSPRCPDTSALSAFSPFRDLDAPEPKELSCLVVRQFESARYRTLASLALFGSNGALCCVFDISADVVEMFPLGTPKDKVLPALSDRFKFRRGGQFSQRRLVYLKPQAIFKPTALPAAPKPDIYDEMDCGYYQYLPNPHVPEGYNDRVCLFFKKDILVDVRADGEWG